MGIIQQAINQIRLDGFIANIATLSWGTLLSQLIIIGISPIVTRLYSPEEIGAYTLVLTIVAIIGPVVNGRLDMTIVTAKNEKDAHIAVLASFSFGLILTLLVGPIFILGSLTSGYSQLHICMAWVLILTGGMTNVLTSFNNRNKQYRLLAAVSIQRALVQSVGQITFGFCGFGALGLLITQLFSCLVGLKKQSNTLLNQLNALITVKFREILQSIKNNYRQPVFSAPAILLNSLSFSALFFLINNLYGLREVGFYSLAFRILGLPVQLITMNVSQVFFREASEELREKANFPQTFKKTTIITTFFSLSIFLFTWLYAERLSGFIFGQEWSRAGLFIEILSPMYFIKLVVSSISLSAIIANKQTLELLLQLAFLIEMLMIYYYVQSLNLSLDYFLKLICYVYSITYLFWYLYLFRVSKNRMG